VIEGFGLVEVLREQDGMNGGSPEHVSAPRSYV
jgi:hypothetical protein